MKNLSKVLMALLAILLIIAGASMSVLAEEVRYEEESINRYMFAAEALEETTELAVIESLTEEASGETGEPEEETSVDVPEVREIGASVLVGVGEKYSLAGAVEDGAVFISENAKFATVDKQGVITAKKAGETKIAVFIGDRAIEYSVTVVKAPTKVALSSKKLSMGVGQIDKLTATLNNGNISAVTYTSSNKKVAVVDSDGVITAVGKGTAKITATSYNKKKAVCTVTVLAAPKEIRLNAAELALPAGMVKQIKAAVDKNAMAGFSYVSSDENVATVDDSGNITAVMPGNCMITVTAYNGIEAVCAVSVTKAPSSISLIADASVIGVGEKLQLNPVNDQQCEASYSYSSSNAKVAMVDQNGLVVAKKAGKAIIVVESYNGLAAQCEISVMPAPKKVELSSKKLSMGVGQMEKLNVVLSNGSAGAFQFKSSKPGVAVVDEEGVITAVGKGAAKITVTTYNKKKATCTVNVLSAPQTITLNSQNVSLPAGMVFSLKPSVESGAMANYACASSDESVATVDNQGNITAVSVGKATITVVSYNGLQAMCEVQVTPAPTVVTLNASELVLGVKEKFQLVAETDQGEEGEYSYHSSAAAVASVDKNGMIIAKKAGKAIITVTSFNGISEQCKITVMNAPTSIKFRENTFGLAVGEEKTLQYALSAKSAGSVKFSSSNETVAAVNENGIVRAVSAGTARITVKTYNGKTAVCTIIVGGDADNAVPFISTQAWVSKENIAVSGAVYSDAVIFRMGYTGQIATADIAEVAYNFHGKYSSMSFDAGFYEGDERNAGMTVIADGKVIQDEILFRYTDAPKRCTIPLNGVDQLVIRFTSKGYDKTKYAIGNISFSSASAAADSVRESIKNFDSRRSYKHYAEVVDEEFAMGGFNYRNGYVMRVGYLNKDYESQLAFDLKGKCKTFSFDIARLPEGDHLSHIRSAYLTIELDGKVVAEYNAKELKWNDVALPVKVNVAGADRMLIRLYSKGYDTVKWGIGNVQIK